MRNDGTYLRDYNPRNSLKNYKENKVKKSAAKKTKKPEKAKVEEGKNVKPLKLAI